MNNCSIHICLKEKLIDMPTTMIEAIEEGKWEHKYIYINFSVIYVNILMVTWITLGHKVTRGQAMLWRRTIVILITYLIFLTLVYCVLWWGRMQKSRKRGRRMLCRVVWQKDKIGNKYCGQKYLRMLTLEENRERPKSKIS